MEEIKPITSGKRDITDDFNRWRAEKLAVVERAVAGLDANKARLRQALAASGSAITDAAPLAACSEIERRYNDWLSERRFVLLDEASQARSPT